MNDFDVIVIGSGIGGLVSAGILTSRGLSTLLIEKHTAPGGYLSSFKRKGFTFDSAVDCISGVAPGGLIYRVLELLDVKKDINFLRVNPIRVSIFPDIRVTVEEDVNAYIDNLSALFPLEIQGIRGFFRKVSTTYNELQILTNSVITGDPGFSSITSDTLKLMNSSYSELLSEYFTDHRLKAALSDRCPFIGLAPSKVSSAAMINLIMSYFRLGAYRAEGCFQKLPEVLISGIKRKGGIVILGNSVKQISVDEQGCCRGVRCDNNEEYSSRYIISNADFNLTFSSLLGGKYSSVAEEMTRNTGISSSFFIVYAGIRGDAGPFSSAGYFPSYDMEKYFMPDMTFDEKSTIGVTVATVEDQSRAPNGCSTLVLHEMTEASGQVLDKSACTEKIINKAESFMPGIKSRISVLDSATPKTLERYTGNFRGAAFGWRQIPGFRGARRHEIKNLHIAGHWGDMGSGVLAAAYSGARAAGEILMKEGIKDVI